jgi:hypothetical protein
LAKKLNTKLILDMAEQKFNYFNRSSILDLNLSRHEEVTWFPHRRVTEKVLSTIPPYVLKGGQVFEKPLRYFRASGLGWEARLDDTPRGSTLKGYFQTYRYFEEFIKQETPILIEPLQPSEWYLKMASDAKEATPIALHLRRGDYVNHLDSIGVLSTEYFLRALDQLLDRLGRHDSEVWVFSDSIETVKGELGNLKGNIRFITPPTDSSAAENLSLFSMASAHVISNSTFSYWGAMLGSGSMVVAPQKWFSGWEDPLDLIPPNWHRLESEFRD